MGFPVGYGDLLLPRLLLHALTFLTLLRNIISILLNFLGLGHFLEPQITINQEPVIMEHHSVGAILIQEMLPVVKFSDLVEPPESCAICLYEFDSNDEVSTLNCRHIFHRCWVVSWLFHDQKTCPLCRASFISKDMQESFNQRMWVASGISEFYGDYSAITTDL